MPQVMYRNFRSRITCLPRPNLNSVVQTETLPLRHYPLAVCVGVWRGFLDLPGWGGGRGALGVLTRVFNPGGARLFPPPGGAPPRAAARRGPSRCRAARAGGPGG